uniref:Uncharacterized protein n=1 Tax=Globodera rostochiensis TaxID=31243 RepID=A0A914I924_GLORO
MAPSKTNGTVRPISDQSIGGGRSLPKVFLPPPFGTEPTWQWLSQMHNFRPSVSQSSLRCCCCWCSSCSRITVSTSSSTAWEMVFNECSS